MSENLSQILALQQQVAQQRLDLQNQIDPVVKATEYLTLQVDAMQKQINDLTDKLAKLSYVESP